MNSPYILAPIYHEWGAAVKETIGAFSMMLMGDMPIVGNSDYNYHY